jgi:hypothetical protein
MVEGSAGWPLQGDYAIWSGNLDPSASPYLLHELVGQRVLPVPISSGRAILHPVIRSTWFEIRYLFGYWMRADVDTVWLDAPGDNGRYYTLCIGGSEARPGEVSYSWVCPRCGTVFGAATIDVATEGFQTFLNAAEEGVSRFNADEGLRTCPQSQCKHVHPLTYGFDKAKDTDATRQARQAV